MRPSRRAAALATLIFLVVLVRTAWMSDDALITLRTVMNVTHGFGLTFNPVERVQTYTHPLWLLLLTAAYLIGGNVFVSTLAVSFAISAIVFWLAVRGARDEWRGWLAAGLLLSSRAFVDYSTSGLENPLSCLWLALLAAWIFDASLDPARLATRGWLLTALLYLTRPDDVLLALPVVIVATLRVRAWPDRLRAIAIGLTPAVAWTLFAIVYYGFPFPNTAYAKLGAGIDRREMVVQGVLYVVESIDRDPLTMTTIAFAAGVALTLRTAIGRALAAGLVLHLAYVIWIGGDFMSGRFLSAPFYLAVLVATRPALGTLRQWAPAIAVLAIVAVAGDTAPPIRSDSTMLVTNPKRNGIADERGLYFGNWSLVQAGRWTFRDPEWPRAGEGAKRGDVFETCGLLGDAGIKRGPYTFIVDECALADPLLARLPAQFTEQWRVGHFRRIVPEGYLRSVDDAANHLADPKLAAYYDKLRLATRAPLFAPARWRAIAGLNAGAYDGLIDRRFYRLGGHVVPLSAVAEPRPDGTPWDAPGNQIVGPSGVAILCPDRPGRRYFDVSLDSNDRYRLIFVRQNRILSEMDLGPIPEYRRHAGLVSYTADVPARARTIGFDTVMVSVVEGDSDNAMGHFLLEGEQATDPELHRRVAIRDGLAR